MILDTMLSIEAYLGGLALGALPYLVLIGLLFLFAVYSMKCRGGDGLGSEPEGESPQ